MTMSAQMTMPRGLFLLGMVKVPVGLALLAASISLATEKTHELRLQDEIISGAPSPDEKPSNRLKGLSPSAIAALKDEALNEDRLRLLTAVEVGIAGLMVLIGGIACFVRRANARLFPLVSLCLINVAVFLFMATVCVGSWDKLRELGLLIAVFFVVPALAVTLVSIGAGFYLCTPTVISWFNGGAELAHERENPSRWGLWVAGAFGFFNTTGPLGLYLLAERPMGPDAAAVTVAGVYLFLVLFTAVLALRRGGGNEWSGTARAYMHGSLLGWAMACLPVASFFLWLFWVLCR
jgi:hypothetical protein